MILMLDDQQLYIVKRALLAKLDVLNIDKDSHPDEIRETKIVLIKVTDALQRNRPKYVKGKEL